MKIAQFIILCLYLVTGINSKADTPPPVLEGVSVDFGTNNAAWVRWAQEDGSYFIRAFIIYRINDNGINVPMDTVNGDMRVWFDQNAPTSIRRCIYSVSLLWSTTAIGPWEPPTATSDELYQTIHLKPDINHTFCAHTNTIRFTEYQIAGDASSYIIWAESDPSTGMQIIEEIPKSDLVIVGKEQTGGAGTLLTDSTNIYAYNHTGVDPNKTYIYRVEAVPSNNSDPHSFSNTVPFTTPPDPQPQPPSINSVSVNDDGSVSINAIIPDVYLCSDAYLKRRIGPSETPVELPLGLSVASLIDDDVATSANAYYYEVFSKNKCGVEIIGTEPHRTMLLEGTIDENFKVNLDWNQYEGWSTTGQKLVRSQDGNNTDLPLNPLDNQYIDDISNLTNREARIEYFVVATGSDPSIQTSRSNILTIQPDFDPILPNAFNPFSSNTLNQTFKPIIDFYNTDGYLFQIYNRWGSMIWETKDPTKGWTGKNEKEELLEKGAYVYILKFQDASQIISTKTGSVVLIY